MRITPRMKSIILLTALLGLTSAAFASDACCPKPEKTAAAPTSASAEYPLDTCVVSGEMLGEMGTPIDYIHKEEGKPDRLVRFCCKMCVGKFKKDPAKYLKRLDAAAAAKTTSDHTGHTM